MFKKSTLVLILRCISWVSGVDIATMNMLMSFITYEERPISVLTPNLCWKPYDLKTLFKNLSNVGISVSHSWQLGRPEVYLHHQLIIADLACPGVTTFLNNANEERFFRSPYRWLLLADKEGYEELLGQLNILVDSDVILAIKNGEQFRLTEVYKISENTQLIFTIRLIWHPKNYTDTLVNAANSVDDDDVNNTSLLTENNNLQNSLMTKYGLIEDYRQTKVLSVRRKNLRGHTFVIANVLADSNDTIFHLEDRLQLQYDVWTKISFLAAKTCFEMLNATEERVFTSTWGYKDKNGSWQGMVDLLMKKEADIGTLALFTKDRLQVVDYIAMVADTSIRFIFREPPLSFITNIFALPFTGTVWIACFFCVLICSIFLFLAYKWESYRDRKLKVSGTDVFILAIGAVLQQGAGTQEPRHPAGRCVFFLLYVALTILFSAYSANIVVLLRAPSFSIRSLTDLLNSPLTLAANDIYYNRYFFKRLNDPLRKAIYEKKIGPKGHYFNVKEGVEKIRKGLFAFHSIVDPVHQRIEETFQEHEKCDLVEIDYLNEIDPWLPAQKRSPYKDLLKIYFLKYHESGLQICNQRRIQAPKPKCSSSLTSFSSVGITDIYHVMLATLYGMLLALGILLVEIIYNKLITGRNHRE